MSRNEAAERLRTGITANEYLLHRDEKAFLADVDEALATERRLTVERVREALSWETVDEFGPEAVIRASLLDDLATADVDEEAGK